MSLSMAWTEAHIHYTFFFFFRRQSGGYLGIIINHRITAPRIVTRTGCTRTTSRETHAPIILVLVRPPV